MDKQRSSETIRLVVKPTFKKRVKKRAKKLGVTISSYITYLLLNDIKEEQETNNNQESN